VLWLRRCRPAIAALALSALLAHPGRRHDLRNFLGAGRSLSGPVDADRCSLVFMVALDGRRQGVPGLVVQPVYKGRAT
jgi:hypothetical protein